MRRFAVLTLAVSFAALFLDSGARAASAPRPRHMAAGSTAEAAYHAAAMRDLKAAKAARDRVLAVKGPRTLANTLRPYDDVELYLDRLLATAGLMEQVHPDSLVRADAVKMEQAGSKLANEISTDPRMYQALKAVDVSHEDSATQYWVFKELRGFRRSGVDRDDSTRARLRQLSDALVAASQRFDLNISEDKSSIDMDPRDLEGMPEDYIKGHPVQANGKVHLTTDYPDYFPYITYAKSGPGREAFFKVFLNKGWPLNGAVLDTLLQLRSDYAHLLGYRNFADYIIEDKMMGSDSAAAAFIERVTKASEARMQADKAELLERKKKDDPAATSVTYSEGFYYSELLKNEKYSYSSQDVRPYFEYGNVRNGVLGVESKLFGVRFKKVAGVPVWHPSVDCYDVFDAKTNENLGRFFLDMHPRPDKYNHAAQFTIQSGERGRQLPIGCLVCNFPESRKGEPGLLEHDDVVTFFHEFGHLMHHILGGHTRWIALAGTNVEQDFVEAPSQLLEEWAWTPEVLQSFARHYQTGKPIPTELVEKLRKARDWSDGGTGKGIYVRQQMFYAALSLDLHNRDPKDVNSTQMVQDLMARYSPWEYIPGTHMQAGFGHLSNYSAVYYTYMWSLVLAKDMFTAFQGHSLLDPTVAARYRKEVIGRGGEAPAARLVHNFLGRDYSTKAFADWLNR